MKEAINKGCTIDPKCFTEASEDTKKLLADCVTCTKDQTIGNSLSCDLAQTGVSSVDSDLLDMCARQSSDRINTRVENLIAEVKTAADNVFLHQLNNATKMEVCLPLIKAVFAAKITLLNQTDKFKAYLESKENKDEGKILNLWRNACNFVFKI